MWSLAWSKSFAIAPKISGLISMLSSAALVYMITRNPLEKNKNKSYHRIMLGMSICDICASFGYFLSAWPKPPDSGYYGAIGTDATCSIQGFLVQISLSTIFYNGTLSIYYLLVLVKKWEREKFAKIEPFLHLNALAWGIGTSIILLARKSFGPAGFTCWISGEDVPSYYKWIFLFGPLWVIILFVTICMSLVYGSMLREEKEDMIYTDDQSASPRKKDSRRLANRAGLYVGAFYLTWIMPTIFEIMALASLNVEAPFLIFVSALFIPMQGFLNLVIYTLPAFAKYRKRDHVKDQFLLLVWFKMLAYELGWSKENNENSENNKNNENNDTTKRREGLEVTLSDWMLNPNTEITTSQIDLSLKE